MDAIFHIAESRYWSDALTGGDYRMSSLGRSLDDEGFIHCSRAAQVEAVANAFYRDVPDLTLLVIDSARVTAPIAYEGADDRGQPFPHIYGPLNLDAVLRTEPFGPGEDGSFGPATETRSSRLGNTGQ
jgi:uncharacterized protein (DUF952 family)